MTEQKVKAIFAEVVKLVEVRVNRINRFTPEGQKLSYNERGPKPELSMMVLREPDSEGKYGWCCTVSAKDDGVRLHPGNNDQIVMIRPSDDLQKVVREFLDSVLPEQGH